MAISTRARSLFMRLTGIVTLTLLLSGVLPLGGASTGHAQPGQPPCVGMLPFADQPVDQSVSVSSLTATVASVPDPQAPSISFDEVRLSWSNAGLQDKAVCI